MVKIHIVAVGKDKDSWVSDGISHFEKLLRRYARLNWTIVTDAGRAQNKSPNDIKNLEAKEIRRFMNGGTSVALTDSGKVYGSRDFAKKIEKLLASSSGELKFIIGGPFGLDKSILDSADELISLSPLTFSHQIVRLVLLEQLYRAFSILNGSDYHK